MTFILPLVLSARAGVDFDVVAALRVNCPLLSKECVAGQNVAELFKRLRTDVSRLVEMLGEMETLTVRHVLIFVHAQELISLDERFIRFLTGIDDCTGDGDETGTQDAAVNAFLDCPAAQLWGYRTYIEDQSPFATQQGVKGAEFKRVLVVLDDEESEYNLFSFGKYFGITPLSNNDRENINEGVDSVLSRTRRLFYVCCSRAVHDLAVVLFVPDIQQARVAVAAKGIFPHYDIHVLED